MAESLTIKIKGDTKEFQSALKGTEHITAKLEQDLSALATKATVAFAGLTATVTGLIATYRTQEQAEKKLSTALESTGHAAGLTKDELTEMASSLQSVSTFGDEAIIGAQSLLLTFTKIGKDVFPQATETILNMSAAMGQDLQSSTLMLGKALNDPILGLTALSRAGIQFTEDQKELVKSFVDFGDAAGAQKIILKELETQFGGQARATAEGTGRFIQLSNTLGDMAEVIGKHLTPPLSQMAEWFNKILVDILGAKGEQFGKTAASILLIATNASILTGGLALTTKALIVARAAVKGLGISLKGLKAALVSTGIGAIIVYVSYLIERFAQDFEANMKRVGVIWKALGEAIKGSWKTTIDYLNKEFEGYMVQWRALGNIVQDIWQATTNIVKKGWTMVAEFVTGKKEELKEKNAVDKEEAITAEQEFVDKQLGIWGNFFEVFGEQFQETENKKAIIDIQSKTAAEKRDIKNRKVQKKNVIDSEKFMMAAQHREAQSVLRSEKLKSKIEKEEQKKRSANLKSTLGTISTLTSSNNQTLFDVGRAASLAMAYIDGSAAVTKALASAPPPFNFALAAAVGAAVAVQIGQIISAKPPKAMADGGLVTGGIPGVDSVPAMLMPGELVVPTRNFEETVGAVGAGRDSEIFGGEGGATQIVIGFDGEEASQVLTAKQIENQALGISREEVA